MTGPLSIARFSAARRRVVDRGAIDPQALALIAIDRASTITATRINAAHATNR